MKSSTILHAIRSLNWQGHVELPDNDIAWLADSIASCISANEDARVCSLCNNFKDITVETKLGLICEDCISDMSDIAEETRDSLSGDES